MSRVSSAVRAFETARGQMCHGAEGTSRVVPSCAVVQWCLVQGIGAAAAMP